MKNKNHEIIYVGKAKKLKNRVSSYFHSVERHLPKVYRMVENVDDFDYIVCDSEIEALILECSLIKLHSPKYNILLKDDKGYHYIRISSDEYPRITEEKSNHGPGDYLGPYISGTIVKDVVETANTVYKLPTCSKNFPRDFGKSRPCLNFHIGKCMGLCSGKISKSKYKDALNDAVNFIKSGGQGVVSDLKEKMQIASESLDFEKAALYRDRIKALEHITVHQKVISYSDKNLDVIAYISAEDKMYITMLILRGGRLRDKRDFSFNSIGTIDESMAEFLVSYYSSINADDLPNEIFLESKINDLDLIANAILNNSNKKISFHIPSKGKGKELCEMAKNNSAQTLVQKTGRSGKELSALSELGVLLGLSTAPEYIEAYDISNFGNQTIVGGMVVFENGRPQKRLYKRFKITDQVIQDDLSAMRQMLTRRMEHYINLDKDPGFSRLPSLWLIDGGANHVEVAKGVLRSFKVDIPCFGMVKDSNHRTRAVTTDNNEININDNKSVFSLITNIQDEVHRFSIEYSRKTHEKSYTTTILTNAPGIGPARAQGLLKYFKTIKAIKSATLEDLASAPGMSSSAAESLFCHLHQSN